MTTTPEPPASGEPVMVRGEVIGAEFFGDDVPDDCIVLRIAVPDTYRVGHMMVDIVEPLSPDVTVPRYVECSHPDCSAVFDACHIETGHGWLYDVMPGTEAPYSWRCPMHPHASQGASKGENDG